MRSKFIIPLALALMVFPGFTPAAQGDVNSLIEKLNSHHSVQGTESSKGWRILFDAYMKMSSPPMAVNSAFDLNTIWPGMDKWSEVSSWARSNPDMADAIMLASQRKIVGLPYGVDNVPATYQSKGVMIEIWADGNIRNNNFAYLDALAEILAYSTAETYRLYEAGEHERAIDLSVAQMYLLRQFADRDFLKEKITSMELLIDTLRNMRDMFYMYGSKFSEGHLREIARTKIPYLRIRNGWFFIPEADRFVAEAIFEKVFNASTGNPRPEKFREVFTEIQADREPLGRFGAGRRWHEIGQVGMHGSLEASRERLTWIFDDWWRRWRIREYGAMLGMETQYEDTNSTRYAAVLFAVEDIKQVFVLRSLLTTEARGTIIAAALCSYRNERGTYPRALSALFPDPLSDVHVVDVYNENLDPVNYFFVNSRTPIEIGADRRWIEPGQCFLYSLGRNGDDDLDQIDNKMHPLHGEDKDLLLWPPTKSLLRDVKPSP